jgi:enoyl-CoA hydratase
VVPTGHSLSEAISLAEKLCKFPQQCLRVDRNSALSHALSCSGENREAALSREYRNGVAVIQESVGGAKQFSQGKGRHGEFE